MSAQQPDPRIRREDLGALNLNGEKYVTHDKVGCPRNACIEEFDGYLRCWACHMPLTSGAARYVRATSKPTDKNSFTWIDVFGNSGLSS